MSSIFVTKFIQKQQEPAVLKSALFNLNDGLLLLIDVGIDVVTLSLCQEILSPVYNSCYHYTTLDILYFFDSKEC